MRVFKQAGVYAPLRIMFHDDGDETTIVTYDAPSKMLGQFDSPLFRQTGDMLEKKMEAVIRTISDRTNQCVNQRNQVQQSKGNDVNYEKRKYQQQKS